MLKLTISAAFAFGLVWSDTAQDLETFERVPLPIGSDAREPSLHATRDGRLLMSWTEASGGNSAVKLSMLTDSTWNAPRTVAASLDLFVNWADFPSVSEFADGTIIAHWLQNSGGSLYDYEVRIALSRDIGETWSAPIVPHQDGTKAQHGFVTLAPLADDMIAIWLDGRAYDGDLVEGGAVSGQMQLRSATISSDGSSTPDIAMDFATCSCCQTSAAVAKNELLVVYRDRTEHEIRDISLVRLSDGRWSSPITVHEDNWELSGCPVNGPSIAASGDQVAVAWFTAPGDIPAVMLAFSNDAGSTFSEAIRIDRGEPLGRVDTLMLDDGSALISWVEWQDSDEALIVCRATRNGCTSLRRLVLNSEGRSINFPQMAATTDGIYVAWTHPLPDGTDTIRMMRSAR